MRPEDNPYINPENYMSGYQDSINKLGENKENIEFDKLCFHVFCMNEDGKRLLEIFKERFIMPAVPGISNPHYDKICMYYEGYKNAFRDLIASVRSYQERKDHEAKLAEGIE